MASGGIGKEIPARNKSETLLQSLHNPINSQLERINNDDQNPMG
jgi:hypothetical protein